MCKRGLGVSDVQLLVLLSARITVVVADKTEDELNTDKKEQSGKITSVSASSKKCPSDQQNSGVKLRLLDPCKSRNMKILHTTQLVKPAASLSN